MASSSQRAAENHALPLSPQGEAVVEFLQHADPRPKMIVSELADDMRRAAARKRFTTAGQESARNQDLGMGFE